MIFLVVLLVFISTAAIGGEDLETTRSEVEVAESYKVLRESIFSQRTLYPPGTLANIESLREEFSQDDTAALAAKDESESMIQLALINPFFIEMVGRNVLENIILPYLADYKTHQLLKTE